MSSKNPQKKNYNPANSRYGGGGKYGNQPYYGGSTRNNEVLGSRNSIASSKSTSTSNRPNMIKNFISYSKPSLKNYNTSSNKNYLSKPNFALENNNMGMGGRPKSILKVRNYSPSSNNLYNNPRRVGMNNSPYVNVNNKKESSHLNIQYNHNIAKNNTHNYRSIKN